MRRRVEAGHTWERSTEWNAVRALLAHEAQTEMGRELAATAEPLTAPRAVVAELELTRQARLDAPRARPPTPGRPPPPRPAAPRSRGPARAARTPRPPPPPPPPPPRPPAAGPDPAA